MYSYGTSGFRFNEDVIFDISYKIGQGVGYLLATKKVLGVMITASHNVYTDNGVKIVDSQGKMIQSNDEKFLEDIVDFTGVHQEIPPKSVNLSNDHQEILTKSVELKHTVFFGKDTRRSCDKIKTEIVKGIRSVIDAQIVDLGFCTTPEFHYLVGTNQTKSSYVTNIKQIIETNDIDLTNVVIDCANGVGAKTLERILTHALINTDTENYPKLNNKCGSDYVMNNYELIKKYLQDKLYASFDGDADRIIFYTNRSLMTGDHISLLILNYVLNNLSDFTARIGVVHTAYSNGGFMEKIDSIANKNVKIDRIMTPIGVKNLILEAEKYDIGIYFESNGHGSVIVNNNFNNEKLALLSKLFNKFTGDAVQNLVGVCYLLTFCTINDFENLFVERKSITTKVKVQDKTIYKTSHDQSQLLEPLNVVSEIKSIISKNEFVGCRVFVRPSGTEDILRLYVENNSTNSCVLNVLTDNIIKCLK